MSYKLVVDDYRHLSNNEVLKLANLPSLGGQRSIRKRHIDRIVLAIESAQVDGRDLLAPPTIVIAILKDGRKFKVDGNHTLIAAAKHGGGLKAIYKEFLCDTEGDALVVRRNFNQGLPDSVNDMAKIYLANNGIIWPPNYVAIILGGIEKLVHHGFHSTRSDKAAERREFIENDRFVSAGNFICDLYTLGGEEPPNNALSTHIRRQPVAGVIAGSWLKNPAKSKEFWTCVRDRAGDAWFKNSPAWHLEHFLTGSTLGTYRTRAFTDKIEMYVKCVRAWNNFREGITSKYIRGVKSSMRRGDVPTIRG